MEKIKLTFDSLENTIIKFSNQKIEVRPYLTIQEQITLIRSYIDAYFYPGENSLSPEESRKDVIGAELSLILGIIDTCTSIDVSELSLDNLLQNGLWQQIRERILNYDDFRFLLNATLEESNKEYALRKSTGFAVDSLVSRVSEFLDALQAIKPEDAEKMTESGLELLKKIEESPISSVFKEAKKSKSKKAV